MVWNLLVWEAVFRDTLTSIKHFKKSANILHGDTWTQVFFITERHNEGAYSTIFPLDFEPGKNDPYL